MRLVERGQARRKVSATEYVISLPHLYYHLTPACVTPASSVSLHSSNHASSRSHTLLFATIIRPFEDGNVTQGTLCLADLAGAESLRGTKTKRKIFRWFTLS